MTTHSNRLLLKRIIEDQGRDLANTSREIERNHAYLQQFIRDGTPSYLKEADRLALEAILQTDLGFLRPPPRPLRAPKQKAAVPPDHGSRLVHEPEQLALLEFWDSLKSENDRIRLFRMLRAYATPIDRQG